MSKKQIIMAMAIVGCHTVYNIKKGWKRSVNGKNGIFTWINKQEQIMIIVELNDSIIVYENCDGSDIMKLNNNNLISILKEIYANEVKGGK